MTPVLFQPDLLGILTLVVAVILPIFVGLITTRITSPGLKAVLLAVAALITSVVTSWISAIQNSQPFDLYQALLTFGGVFLVAVASHFGFWKPTGASAAAQNALGGVTGKHTAAMVPTPEVTDAQSPDAS